MAGPPVVVGVDGSRHALEAAQWAAGEAARRKAPLRIIAAEEYPEWGPTLAAGPMEVPMSEEVRARARSALDTAAAAAARVAVDAEVSTEIADVVAKKALLAASEDAAVLVVGHRGRGGVLAGLLGSVAMAAMAHAACPVVVVRGLPGDDPDAPVVVGTDGSTTATAAVQYAADAAARENATLLVVVAWHSVLADSLASAYYGAALGSVEGRTGAEETGRHAAAQVADAAAQAARHRAPRLSIESVVVAGHPARAILSAAPSPRLVVVGAQGHGFAGLRVGSVSQGVVHGAACPVAVLRGS